MFMLGLKRARGRKFGKGILFAGGTHEVWYSHAFLECSGSGVGVRKARGIVR